MCRLYGFRSSVLSSVHASLVAAENALARQSEQHRDGWGLAYYNDRFPHLVRNDKQAMDDGLYREVSAVVATRTLLAHIRNATAGKVGVLNCHPFQHGPWTFAHNGRVAGFTSDEAVRQRLRQQVDPRFHKQILGTTDSEVCFFLFLSRLARRVDDIYHEGVRVELVEDALREAIDTILDVAPDLDETESNSLNFVFTNGSIMLGTRFRRSLFFSTHKSRCPERDTCPAFEASRCEEMARDGIVKHMVLSSEQVADNPNVWIELADGEYVGVDHGMNLRRGTIPSLR